MYNVFNQLKKPKDSILIPREKRNVLKIPEDSAVTGDGAPFGDQTTAFERRNIRNVSEEVAIPPRSLLEEARESSGVGEGTAGNSAAAAADSSSLRHFSCVSSPSSEDIFFLMRRKRDGDGVPATQFLFFLFLNRERLFKFIFWPSSFSFAAFLF